jgi:pyridoxal biosynthesis lyase PdxS
MDLTRLPRRTFDAVERPVASASESLMRKDAFMDALALAWKVRRSALRRVERGAAAGMRVVGVPSRADVVELVNQIGSLQREVRELRREVERS